MTVVVCAAHADDEAIGVGGTIAKLASEGEKVVVIIFSYGNGALGRLTSWPPTMSSEKLAKVRVAESKKAGEILGVRETIFLGMRNDLTKEINEEQKKKITEILKKYKPKKIFFHSAKDGHADHLAVNRTMNEIIKKMKIKPEVYKYQINFFDAAEKDSKWIIDISDHFKKKLKAMEQFKSQIIWVAPLKFIVLLKGIFYGKKNNVKFAEYFYSE